MSDPLTEMLAQISDKLQKMGGGQLVLVVDWPVTITLVGGRTLHSTVHVLWTGDGPRIEDMEDQVQRLSQEIEVAAAAGEESPGI